MLKKVISDLEIAYDDELSTEGMEVDERSLCDAKYQVKYMQVQSMATHRTAQPTG